MRYFLYEFNERFHKRQLNALRNIRSSQSLVAADGSAELQNYGSQEEKQYVQETWIGTVRVLPGNINPVISLFLSQKSALRSRACAHSTRFTLYEVPVNPLTPLDSFGQRRSLDRTAVIVPEAPEFILMLRSPLLGATAKITSSVFAASHPS